MRSASVDMPTAAVLKAPLPDDSLAALEAARARTLRLIAGVSEDDLERQIDPLMSPLVWDLAHIAAFEDLWLVHRHAGRPLLHPELTALYDAFETPRQVRGQIELLGHSAALEYLDEVRTRTLDAAAEHGTSNTLHELVLRHELQHTETMLQAMRLGGLATWLDELPAAPGTAADGADREWIELPAGEVEIGSSAAGFAYDNERPAHTRRLAPFRISAHPVSARQRQAFIDDGGWDDQRHWSREGWAWRASCHTSPAFEQDDTAAPACHMSWFEAEALASWRGLRLPSEAEWEHAARSGALQQTGQVWEWTSSEFDGYPGFRAEPYREYSEVFFGTGMPVLRGGSFASHPRVAGTTFRNWDHRARRQIFAGVRLAEDLQ